jgi:hypothetical protein
LRAAALTALVAIALSSIWLIPAYQGDRWQAFLPGRERPLFVNEARRTVLQFWGGLVVLLGLYFGWRRIVATDEANRLQRERQLAERESQVTERFTNAVEQLGHAQLEVRVGAIYALERIAKDSFRDSWTIVEILSAYVRSHCAAPQPPSADVQAALSVLGRRPWIERESSRQRVDLSGTILDGYDLSNAKLQRCVAVNTHFSRANLFAADLSDASLRGATFESVYATLAVFEGAYAAKSRWQNVQLISARLARANLKRAVITNVDLTRANFTHARLDAAVLSGTKVTAALFEGANFSGAVVDGVDFAEAKGVKL